MAKQKSFTPISSIEQDLQAQTRELYQNTPTATPPAPVQQVAPEPRKMGRRTTLSIIPRQNGKLIFFEERHNRAIEEIHWQCKADRQDVVRTAVDLFIQRYMVDGQITEEGQRLIREYYDLTHPQ